MNHFGVLFSLYASVSNIWEPWDAWRFHSYGTFLSVNWSSSSTLDSTLLVFVAFVFTVIYPIMRGMSSFWTNGIFLIRSWIYTQSGKYDTVLDFQFEFWYVRHEASIHSIDIEYFCIAIEWAEKRMHRFVCIIWSSNPSFFSSSCSPTVFDQPVSINVIITKNGNNMSNIYLPPVVLVNTTIIIHEICPLQHTDDKRAMFY